MRRIIFTAWILLAILLLTPPSLWAESTEGPSHDTTITLRGQQFDPLARSGQKASEAQLTAQPGQTRPTIVQFVGPLTRQQATVLKDEFGLSLREYIPKWAFLEELTTVQAEALQKLDFFRWSGPYEPTFKIDPMIGKHVFETRERRAEPGILLTVVTFPRTDLAALAERVRGLGFEVVSITDEPEYRIQRLQVRVHVAGDAESLARLRAVKSIEEVGEVTLNNDTTSWVIQSNANNSRPLWDLGLQGQHQIIGHIDGVIDITSCFFRDDADNTVRPDHRKVVGLRNSSADSFSDHGTFSAGNAAGEDVNNDALSPAPNASNGNAPRARLTHGNLSDLDLNAGGGTSVYSYLSQAAADGASIVALHAPGPARCSVVGSR